MAGGGHSGERRSTGEGAPVKTATFTVHATAEQSRRWKQAAEAEGYPSAGVWLSKAADAYLKQRARAGAPIPLAWTRGCYFRVHFAEDDLREVRGWLSSPFGLFRGNRHGQKHNGHRYFLVYVPTARLLATCHSMQECKAIAAELARVWVRWDGRGTEPPSQEPARIVERLRV
jgi:hypothetical protein